MKNRSSWRAVRLSQTQLERALHQRYSLRMHGLLIGTVTLLFMWGIAALQGWLGLDSLALRYLITVGAGYLLYLLILRWWARAMVHNAGDLDALGDGLADLAEAAGDVRDMAPRPGVSRASTGDPGGHAGTGAASEPGAAGSAHASPEGLDGIGGGVDGGVGIGGGGGGALDALAGLDDAAVVVVPVVGIFLIGVAIVIGAGALVLLYFGFETLLAVAVELAFSYAAARTAARISREGWLGAAVRLSWKPMLGAVLCAVLLGACIDFFIPQAHSLPAAVRLMLGR